VRMDVLAWACLALVLISAEILAPGVFLLWLGIAAAVMFIVVLFVPELPLLVQGIAFALLSFASIAVYRRWFRTDAEHSDQPLLNRRAEQFIGRVFVLDSPLADGYGQIRIGDAYWTVTGPDLPAGSKVRVIGADTMTLKVSPE
jgi:membrane protein implicated in regulation of membrane protease activity